MKALWGTFGFYVAGVLTFRLVYGAWPPHEGHFGQWLIADSKAQLALAVGMLAGMVGAMFARALSRTFNRDSGNNHEASGLTRRGLMLHEQRRIEEARHAFERAIEIYNEAGQPGAAAPVYGCLAKLLFDIGELDTAETALNRARELYSNRFDAQEAIRHIDALADLISERRQPLSGPIPYTDGEYHFSFVIAAGWLKQKQVHQFASTGGRIAVSHSTHAATLNISVGPPDRPEWSSKEARARDAKEYVRKIPRRIGGLDVRTSDSFDGEENAVAVEYEIEADVRGERRQRRAGFISVIHRDIEYVVQWSAERDLEPDVRQMISSFRFGQASEVAAG
jgi:tetratricopeptide (TPR) repeat protein